MGAQVNEDESTVEALKNVLLSSSCNVGFAYSVLGDSGWGSGVARTHVPVPTALSLKVLCKPAPDGTPS